MIDDTDLDFSLIRRAGLTHSEFAALVGAGRVSVLHWTKGRRRPSRHIRPRVKKALALLERAIDAGQLPGNLPTPRAGSKHERVHYIRGALQQP